ncbi:GIY-YIG nuclease family protein [Aliiroseovarius sp. M344]|uniref:GIY-YIG nuclease family protein n=1 Tax=Aliiroseovarius sp. M344 TaxID=2867010 RepID=UPI0021AD8596|nr:GIY-YIG nuclease family protein [Aliiroseovarius sp. M344]UWQ15435.1 GIY-YIG nuclease family protein [Aliiroseovarius sp. M344]
MALGRSVRLFLAEGTPTGVVTAEIINWTGHVLAAPRTKLDVALKREELRRTGIYILFGSPIDSSLPNVYVGEGDDISKRLYSHSKDEEKDFWDRFIAITNKDMNLTKAHVKYLEGRLITLLKSAKKSVVTNRTDPDFDRLPEADISDMEAFLEEIQLVLPVIGVDFFRKAGIQKSDTETWTSKTSPVFVLVHEKKGIDAVASEIDGEFVLQAGSTGDLNESVSFKNASAEKRKQVLASGRAEQIGDNCFRLIDDVAFSSPSGASVFLFGTARNGRTDWLVKGTTQTYAEWQASQLD